MSSPEPLTMTEEGAGTVLVPAQSQRKRDRRTEKKEIYSGAQKTWQGKEIKQKEKGRKWGRGGSGQPRACGIERRDTCQRSGGPDRQVRVHSSCQPRMTCLCPTRKKAWSPGDCSRGRQQAQGPLFALLMHSLQASLDCHHCSLKHR